MQLSVLMKVVSSICNYISHLITFTDKFGHKMQRNYLEQNNVWSLMHHANFQHFPFFQEWERWTFRTTLGVWILIINFKRVRTSWNTKAIAQFAPLVRQKSCAANEFLPDKNIICTSAAAVENKYLRFIFVISSTLMGVSMSKLFVKTSLDGSVYLLKDPFYSQCFRYLVFWRHSLDPTLHRLYSLHDPLPVMTCVFYIQTTFS